VITQAGYHIENKSIEVIIKNQPFISYRNENNSIVELHYYILAKGHFQDWSSDMPNPYSRADHSYGEYTVLTYGLGGNNGSDIYHRQLGEVIDGGKVDFKVQALTGYSTRIQRSLYESQFGSPYYWVFTVVKTSDWSNTQTITITESSTSASTPKPSSTLPNMGPTSSPIPNNADLTVTLTLIILSIFVVVVVSLLLYVRHLKRNIKKT